MQPATRPWHQLTPIKGGKLPSRLVFLANAPQVIDHPDGVKEHRFLCGQACACYLKDGIMEDRREISFRRQEIWWDFLDSVRYKDGATWVFAHQIGYQLTLLDFWDRLDIGCESLLMAIIDDPPTVITTRRGRRIVRYVDVRNYWPTTCGDMGGLGDSGRDVAGDHPRNADEWHAKLRRHVRGQADRLISLLAYLARSGLYTWAATAASLSWGIYRQNFLQSPVHVHAESRVLALERKAMFGGLSLLNRLGHVREPVTVVDANSLYPYVMRSNQQPCKLVRYYDGCSLKLLKDALLGYVCVAEVDAVGSEMYLPRKVSGHTSFGGKAGRLVLCASELSNAVAAGLVSACYQLAVYQPSDLFSRFVDHFYELKVASLLAGKQDMVSIAKLILNSLHGKFGQKGRRWEDDRRQPAPDRYASWWLADSSGGNPVRYRSISSHVQRLSCGGETRHSCPSVAACITAYARSVMATYIAIAGQGAVAYADTDSLHVLGFGKVHLERAGLINRLGLGLLKNVCAGDDAYYWSAKHYRVGTYWTCGTLAHDAVQVATGTWLQDNCLRLQHRLETGQLKSVLAVPRTTHIDRAGYIPERELRRVKGS